MALWHPDAERVPTAAFWPGMDAEFPAFRGCMVHIMQGYQSTMIRWAQERPWRTAKSAHFTIGRSGRLVQHVPLGSRSWAAGRACNPTWPQLSPSQLRAANPRSVNHTVVNFECEGFSKDPVDYGYDYVYDTAHPWPQALVTSLINALVWVHEELGLDPSGETIIGHRDTDSCTRADDPGWAFPMASVRAIVAARASSGGSPPAPAPEGSESLQQQIDALSATQAAQAADLTALKGDAEAQQAAIATIQERIDRHLQA